MQTEIWREIKGYECFYMISNKGRVRSFKRRGAKILKQHKDKDGYMKVTLSSNNNLKTFSIHILVYQTFHGPIPEGLVIDHKDNIKANNSPDNLQAITQRENNNKDRSGETSKYRGVYWNKRIKKWHSRIYIDKKSKHLGFFISEEDARDAYQEALRNINLKTKKSAKSV